MLRSLLFGLTCCAFSGLTACGSSQNMTWAYSASNDASYADSLDDWTRKDEVFSKIDQQILLYATLHSPNFAGAQAQWEVHNLGLQGEAAQSLIDSRVAQAENEVAFFLAVSTYDSMWNDLDSAQPSLKLFLRCGEEELTPTSIKRLNVDQMADAQLAYPYAGPLMKAYRVKFDRPSTKGDLKLRLAGAPGQIVLNWEIR